MPGAFCAEDSYPARREPTRPRLPPSAPAGLPGRPRGARLPPPGPHARAQPEAPEQPQHALVSGRHQGMQATDSPVAGGPDEPVRQGLAQTEPLPAVLHQRRVLGRLASRLALVAHHRHDLVGSPGVYRRQGEAGRLPVGEITQVPEEPELYRPVAAAGVQPLERGGVARRHGPEGDHRLVGQRDAARDLATGLFLRPHEAAPSPRSVRVVFTRKVPPVTRVATSLVPVNFRELPTGEVRGTTLPRTRTNRGQEKGPRR